MRFVAFEGGGEAITALQGGHIQVFSGDAAETMQQIKAGSKVRILAVMADKRLTGDLANMPTAKEQGVDIEWPIIRGFYVGPKVSDADFKVWTDTFAKMMATPAYDKLRTERGLYPFSLTGAGDGRLRQEAGGRLSQAGRRSSASPFRPLPPPPSSTLPAPRPRRDPAARRHPEPETSMSDRILGAACVATSAAMAWAARDYAAAISYEPVGPSAFPLLLAGLMAAGGLWLVLKPDAARRRLPRRAAAGAPPCARLPCWCTRCCSSCSASRWPPP